MTIKDQYRYIISGYLGVKELDSYDLKHYILKDMEKYIKEFIETNPVDYFDFAKEVEDLEKNNSLKTKLQDAILVLNKIDAPIDLIILIKQKIKELQKWFWVFFCILFII